MKSSLFHINADGSLAAMLETPYESEGHIQRLLAEHPEILAGDQFTQRSRAANIGLPDPGGTIISMLCPNILANKEFEHDSNAA